MNRSWFIRFFGVLSIGFFMAFVFGNLAGCAASRAMDQPSAKDLSVLTPGTPRSQVILELGAPVATDNEAGRQVDYFRFTQGYSKGARRARAFTHGVLGIATLGLWNVIGVPVESVFDGTDVAIAVYYDPMQRVDKVKPLKGEDEIKGETVVVQRGESAAQDNPGKPASAVNAQYSSGYSYRIAAIIGINNYDNWPPLEAAKTDAEQVASMFRARGFETIEIYDKQATRERILQLLGEDLQQRTRPESLAVVYFAGHGQTETLPNNEKRGYIIPVDGDKSRVFSTAISMAELRDLANRLPAKHIFFAMDSCYSGLGLIRGVPETAGSLEKGTQRRAVQMITAGREGEEAFEVGGNGVFTKYFLRALEGEADINGDGYVTASEIGGFVPGNVAAASNSKQTPMFGTLEGSGEIVFNVVRLSSTTQPEKRSNSLKFSN